MQLVWTRAIHLRRQKGKGFTVGTFALCDRIFEGHYGLEGGFEPVSSWIASVWLSDGIPVPIRRRLNTRIILECLVLRSHN